ncbi:MAG: hypothetical protein JMJ93_04920 [Synergistaceae bacterium]|jgi:desulfoferrodoxin (superoxide reductase-like protein)|nr:hypothetical protein [Synergistaceae bacterium]
MKSRTAAALAAALLIATSAWAHPPREIRLAYDGQDQLTLSVFHGVEDGTKHFIEKIEVRVGTDVVAERSFSSQTGPEGMEAAFSVGRLASGTTVKVKAQCNIFGSLEATYQVP